MKTPPWIIGLGLLVLGTQAQDGGRTVEPDPAVPPELEGEVDARLLAQGNWTEKMPLDGIGTSIALVGDLDGGGAPDLLVGCAEGSAHWEHPRRSQWVQLHRGSAWVVSMETREVIAQWPGRRSGDRFGHSVAALSDVNQDGTPDFAVGAPGRGDRPGSVEVFCGAELRSLRVIEGDEAKGRFGWTLVGEPRHPGLDRPGFLVGAPGPLGTEQKGGGAVYGFDCVGLSRRWKVRAASKEGVTIGVSAAWIGDQDGDGVREVAVGAPAKNAVVEAGTETEGEPQGGGAWVLSGGTGERIRLIPAPGGVASSLGGSVLAIPDRTGDGQPELVLSTAATGGLFEFEGPPGPETGEIAVLDSVLGSVLWTRSSGERKWGFGWSLAYLPELGESGRGPRICVGVPGGQYGGRRGGLVVQLDPATGETVGITDSGLAQLSWNFGVSLAVIPDRGTPQAHRLAVGAPGSVFEFGAVELHSVDGDRSPQGINEEQLDGELLTTLR